MSVAAWWVRREVCRNCSQTTLSTATGQSERSCGSVNTQPSSALHACPVGWLKRHFAAPTHHSASVGLSRRSRLTHPTRVVAGYTNPAPRPTSGGRMKYILALDSGTTSARAIVFDRDGAVRAVAQKEFAQLYPQPGWVEHDPLEIWTAQISVAVEALGRAGLGPTDVAAVGITNQRETTVVWDRADRRAGRATPSSGRTAAPPRSATSCGPTATRSSIRDRTGLVIDAYFSGSKLAWILDNVPGARAEGRGRPARVRHHRHLAHLEADRRPAARHRLVSNASRTMLFNIHTRQVGRRAAEAVPRPARRCCRRSGRRARSTAR